LTARESREVAEAFGDAHEANQPPGSLRHLDYSNNIHGRNVGAEAAANRLDEVWMADHCQELERNGTLVVVQ